jgi:hypothetical protein
VVKAPRVLPRVIKLPPRLPRATHVHPAVVDHPRAHPDLFPVARCRVLAVPRHARRRPLDRRPGGQDLRQALQASSRPPVRLPLRLEVAGRVPRAPRALPATQFELADDDLYAATARSTSRVSRR